MQKEEAQKWGFLFLCFLNGQKTYGLSKGDQHAAAFADTGGVALTSAPEYVRIITISLHCISFCQDEDQQYKLIRRYVPAGPFLGSR